MLHRSIICTQVNNQKVHPIHILYSVIALTVVVWSVLYYQVKNAPPILVEEDISPPTEKAISSEERARVMAEITNASNTPKLSNTERSKTIAEAKKESNTPSLSAEERMKIEQELSNN